MATPPRYLFAHTIVNAHRRVSCCGTQLMFWPLTLLTCVCYSLGMSYLLVTLASRAICLLSIHKNSLGAFLCLLSGFPDLITVVLLSRRPGMQQMAASNAFGSFAFNSCFSLGFPWVVIGLYSDVFPPSASSWTSGFIGFGSIGLALVVLCVARLKLTRALGVVLLLMYVTYLILIVSGAAVDVLQNTLGSLWVTPSYEVVI